MSQNAFTTYRNEQGLTRQEQIFIFAYIREGDARRAAAEAGVAEKEISAWVARAMVNTNVTRVIAAEQARIANKYAISAERVLGEMARVAFSNVADMSRLDADGIRTVDLSDAGRDELAAVQELTNETRYEVQGTGKDKTVTPVTTVKVKLYPKMDALRALGTNLGLLANRTELTGANGGPIEIKGGGVSSLLTAIQQRSQRALENATDVEPDMVDVTPTPAKTVREGAVRGRSGTK